MEPDPHPKHLYLVSFAFQSTGSVWSPTEGGALAFIKMCISIHGLRVEPDVCTDPEAFEEEVFQSTGSVWSPTGRFFAPGLDNTISIHGLRVEPDPRRQSRFCWRKISIHGLRVEPDNFKN